MSAPFFNPGPTPGTVINSPGELDALVADAEPLGEHGMTFRSDTAPDIGTYSIYENFIWIDTSGPRTVKRTYNTSLFTWDAELPEDGSITGDMIADNTITLDKLYAPAGLGGYVLRLNAGSTLAVWDSPLNLFADNTFAISRLVRPGAGSFVLSSDGTTNTWATVISLIAAGTLTPAQISSSGATAKQGLFFYGGVVGWQWIESMLRDNTTPINKLELGGANNIPLVNSGGTAWEFKTMSQLSVLLGTYFQGSPSVTTPVTCNTLNAGNRNITPIAHGLGHMPRYFEWRIRCIDVGGNQGYAENDEVPLHALASTATGQNPYSGWATTTHLKLVWGQAAEITHATSGAQNQPIDEAKWAYVCYYS